METIDEILSCKVCMDKMNESERKPLFLQCGHTFCAKCLRLIYHKPNIQCPLDKSQHKYDTFDKIPTNFQILNFIDSEKQRLQENQEGGAINGAFEFGFNQIRKCQKHPKQQLKFYCVNDQLLICQDCLLCEHLGSNHQIESSEKHLEGEILMADLNKCLDKVKAHEKQIQEEIKSKVQALKDSRLSVVEATKSLISNIQNQLNECIEQYDQVIYDSGYHYDVELEKLQQFEESIKQMQDLIQSQEGDKQLLTQNVQKLIKAICDHQVDDKSEMMEIDDCIYVNGDLAKHLFVQKIQNPDPQLKTLLQGFKTRDVINQQVYDLMIKVDRKNFVTDDVAHAAYSDIPRSIGWGATISAPHMHAMTLQSLCEKAVQGGKALDIGTGSGYVAACLAEFMGRDSKVYMIDHIKDILDFANNNIKKSNPYLLKQKRLVSLLMDGRKGYASQGPYDIIHVGGAVPLVDNVLLDQLKPGGRMWVPVGSSFTQQIQVIDKDLDGNITKQKIMDVRYGSLTSVEDQMSTF